MKPEQVKLETPRAETPHAEARVEARIEVSPDDAASAQVLLGRYKASVMALGHHRHQAALQERALMTDVDEASAAVDAYVRVLRERYLKDIVENPAPYSFIDGVFIRR